MTVHYYCEMERN